MKREDFESGQWKQDMIIGGEKVEIDGFTFDKQRVANTPYLFLMLLLCIDPTEKQKEILNKFGVVFTDDNKKQLFPRENEDGENKTDNED